MADESESADAPIFVGNRYFPAHVFGGSGNQCPLLSMPVWSHTDRSLFVSGDLDHEGIPVEDAVVEPGFLVLYLAGIEFDEVVESSAKALHMCLVSLFSTCGGSEIPVHFEKIRTMTELSAYMARHGTCYSHVVIIGHGHTDGIRLLDKEDPISDKDWANLLGCAECGRDQEIISLCCYTAGGLAYLGFGIGPAWAPENLEATSSSGWYSNANFCAEVASPPYAVSACTPLSSFEPTVGTANPKVGLAGGAYFGPNATAGYFWSPFD